MRALSFPARDSGFRAASSSRTRAPESAIHEIFTQACLKPDRRARSVRPVCALFAEARAGWRHGCARPRSVCSSVLAQARSPACVCSSSGQQNTKCIIHYWLCDIQRRLLQGIKTPRKGEKCAFFANWSSF